MNTKTLGNSDLDITPIGFGAWAVGGDWQFGWGAQEDNDSVAAIHRALELGINWIDTAAVYGLGHSEEVVAKALQIWTGTRPFVFTKCGMVWDDAGKVDYSLKAASIRRECEQSLRRLGVEVIDLYQAHWPSDDIEETLEGWAEMARLQQEGKVRWISVSNFSREELEKAGQIAPVTSLQPPYSLIKRDIEAEVLPYCQQQNVGVIVYSPMASGLLTGAMSRERAAALPENDWRSRNPEFKEPKLGEPRPGGSPAPGGREPGPVAGGDRRGVDAPPSGGHRGYRGCPQRPAGGRHRRRSGGDAVRRRDRHDPGLTRRLDLGVMEPGARSCRVKTR